MMMPANFSAISENEMTYVNGGASLAEILAPELKVENWQKFNTNMVTIIGNSFMSNYIKNTVGVLFNGAYKPGNLGNAWLTGVKGAYGTGVLNAGLRMVGSAAAIYNLATGTVKNDASEKAWTIAG